jgi:GNAT superfamily N-acetyltransferase
MQITLRPSRTEDFDFCAKLYFSGMEKVIRELNLDADAQAAGLREQWDSRQVRIITVDGAEIGWLQSFDKDGSLFLAQLFVGGEYQGRGIGTEVVKRLIDEAALARMAVTLGVVKTNPAIRLYTRLGFRVAHEDDRKFYMRRDPCLGQQTPN